VGVPEAGADYYETNKCCTVQWRQQSYHQTLGASERIIIDELMPTCEAS